MKNLLNLKTIGVALIATLMITSCANSDQVVTNNLIQKRKYNKGFFVNSGKNKKDVSAFASNQTKSQTDELNKEVTSTAANKEVNTGIVKNSQSLTASTTNKIEVETATNALNQEEPKTSAPIEAKVYASKRVQKVIEKAEKAQKKQNLEEASSSNAPAAAAASGKSQIVALILAALVGGLGIHRFYLGYTWQGIVQLLTLGACGIWSLIDLIRIITGDLGPKDGRYSKTL